MVQSDREDALTQINTALNRSMVLMEDPVRSSPKPKDKRSRKSITINTAAMKATSTPLQEQDPIRKSILKRTERERSDETLSPANSFLSSGLEPERAEEPSPQVVDRPHNLEEFVATEQVTVAQSRHTYTLEDVDPEDELWILEIPKSVNPRELRGQVLHLGDKTKMKIGGEKYQAMSHDTSDCLTCVFGTGREEKPFKIVNIRPSGNITMRRRLAAVAKARRQSQGERTAVPFPTGLKPRDPLTGASANAVIKKKSKSRVKKVDVD
ncbi:uncharacterized protein LOC107038321 [Diachasma alloeum]|uniref:uncharacterized protein LOC107038321 n=1 Tax=Diachasma alloeum TaxID=454923 RepID=UPI0007383B08|nr:uncharacterized protein LOC107038321 [Diachasma alloeum]